MFATITKSAIIAVFDVIYISILVFLLVKEFTETFKNEMEYCKNRQDNLYKTLLSLKTLIDMDKAKQDELINNINNINILNKQFGKDNQEVSKNTITFPHFTLFNDGNYEPKKHNGYRELKPDLYLLSEQLAKYLDKENGTCMTFDEIYIPILSYLNNFKKYPNTLINILRIPENENHDITLDIFKKHIQSHLTKVN